MAKEKKTLTPQEEMFCSNYCSIGTPTFGKKGASALAAKYSKTSAANMATRLLRREDIQQRIVELHTANMARNMVTTDSVLSNLAHDRLLAREKGDLATAVRCSELEARWLAMLTDRQVVDVPKQRELDSKQKAEAVELARTRLALKYPGLDTGGKQGKDLSAAGA